MAIVFNVESPENNTVSKFSVIRVEGWIFSSVGKKIHVYGIMDKKKFIPQQQIMREDVRDAYPDCKEYALQSGFYYLIELNAHEKKKDHVIQIFASEEGEEEQLLGSYQVNSGEESNDLVSNIRKAWLYSRDYITRKDLPKSLQEWKRCISKIVNIVRYGKTVEVFSVKKSSLSLDPYKVWSIKNSMDEEKLRSKWEELEKMTYQPLISVVMPAYNTDIRLLKEAIESVCHQIYPNWELCVVDDCSKTLQVKKCVESFCKNDSRIHFYRLEKNSHISAASNYGVERSSGEFIFLMDHDDLVTENALFEVVKALNQDRSLDVIYSDDDKIDMKNVPYDPQFKPEFSPELLLSYMYFSHIFVMRRTLFDQVGGFRIGYEGSQDYDLALRLTEQTDKIHHIPQILYHWRATPQSTAFHTDTKPYSITAGQRAVEDAVARRNIPARVYQPEFAVKGKLGIFALAYNGKDRPLISIVIPTKNHRELLKRCIDSICQRSTYDMYEIVIVDNCSDEEDCLNYLASLPHRVVKVANRQGGFNFSQLVNEGVRNAKGEYVILLNNDTEVMEPSWMESMLVYMKTEGVGIVGAKLLYSDKRVQHGGVVLRMGNGIAGHAFKLLPDYNGGYPSYAKVARNYSAVTAACFMTSREIYNGVNGFDEENYAVSYNDVDFCLRVREKGYRVVYNPQALLYHHEGKSRGVEQSGHYSDPGEEYRFFKRWIRSRNLQDPYFNPNLSYQSEQFAIDCEKVYCENRRELKVLLITHNLNYEGAPLVQYHAAEYLIRQGYEFAVLSSEEGLLRKEYEKLGIPVIVEDINRLKSGMEFSWFRNRLMETAGVHKLESFDIFYANTVECFWGVTLGELLKRPVVWGIHESIDYRNYFANLDKAYQEEFVNCFLKATKVLFVSDATAKMYEELDTYNVAVIKNGIEIGKIDSFKEVYSKEQCREAFGYPENAVVVTVVGTVCERKGQMVFARAAKLLVEENPDKTFVFQMIGAKESIYLYSIREYLQQNQLESCFRIVKHAPNEEIYRYYRATDIFVCSSFEESSPLVILEAMAFEIPIVSTNVFGIPEQVRDRQDALLINANDERAMADRIRELAGDGELRRCLKEHAYYRVKTYFSMDQMIEQYDCLLQSVYEERKNKIYEKMFGHR